MTDDQIVSAVSAALDCAVELAEEEDAWKTEKNKEGRKVWLCKAEVDLPSKVLWEKLQDTDSLTTWNTTLTEAKVVKKLDEGVQVTYSVTCEGGGGVVSARDFVYGSKSTVRSDGVCIMGGLSVEVS